MSEVHQEKPTETTTPPQAEPIAVTLCRATNMWPTLTEDYNGFMTEKLLPEFDSLSKAQTELVPAEARDWAYQAIEAFNNGNPLNDCPGYDDVFEVEDRTPMFEKVEGEEGHEKPVRGKGKGKRTAGANGKSKAKTDKTKGKGGSRESRPLSTGKTSRIMDEVWRDPKISVEQIMANLAKAGIQCVKPSTTVVRSFYRHSIKHLKSKGVNIPLDL